MSGLQALAACAGAWQGTNRLHDPNTGAPEDSPSTLTIAPVLDGSFLRVEYTWAYQGAPQEGMLLLGYETKANAATAFWIDTWHMGDQGLTCRGTVEADGSVSVKGTYAAPPGPDWGWRTVLQPGAEAGTLHLRMYNIWPDGREDPAVETTYRTANT